MIKRFFFAKTKTLLGSAMVSLKSFMALQSLNLTNGPNLNRNSSPGLSPVVFKALCLSHVFMDFLEAAV